MVRFGIVVTVVEIVLDRFFEVVYAVKNPAPNALHRDVPEETLDQVDPRGRGRCEVQMKPGMPGQPFVYVGVLVGCIPKGHK
jgi:hypothetical protein